MFKSRFWKNFDWLLAGVTLLLAIIGILILFSSSRSAGGSVPAADVRNQLIFLVLAVGVMVGLAWIDYRVWAQMTGRLYVVMLGSLALVEVLGKTALGATRWINLGFFQFQPSELAKLILIIIFAKVFSEHYDQLDSPKYLLLSLGYLALPLLLVLAQPDLGTGIVLVIIWLAMALVSRMPKRYPLGLIALGIILLPVATTFLKPYQRQRLDTFFQPTANPLGSGYNVVQSTIAVGSGQLLGRGLAAGSQSQLNFLPSQQTDFIFAVLAEKLGFVGGVLLVTLFGVLLFRILAIGYGSQDRFGLFLAVGVVAMLLIHVVVNIGMNLGIMPVTGIPLPFISYGGTNLIISLAAIGLVESVVVRRKKIEFGT